MSKQQPCAHLSAVHHASLHDFKLDENNACANCHYAGPNLWICLYKKCMLVGCSEQANDHSTEHFQRSKDKSLHCIHMNLSSQRAWCYLCEREVPISGVERPAQIVDPVLRAMRYSDEENDSDYGSGSSVASGLVGLQNIANTCYMNSAIQALSNVLPMTHYFLNCGDLMDHTLEQGAHRCKAGLAKSYQRLMRDMWRKRDEGKTFLAPRSILYGIRSVHPMFRGFQQHDTQEFLRCFMDQLHEELKETALSYEPNKRKHSIKENEDEDDSMSGISSTSSSSQNLDTNYVTCDSSNSEQSSLCENFVGSTSQKGAPKVVQQSAAAAPPVAMVGKMLSSSTATTTVRSIVSEIFDGKLLSSVQCLTCDRISTREETFQDLSLPIPNRDFLNVLHQTNSMSVQSLNSIDSTATTSTAAAARAQEGWISWLWNIVRSWLWGPSVTLHDCMANFFSADELKGDNMYSCEKCNKLRTGVKYSRVLELPEVLCIHLKRFRHDLSYSSKISAHVEFPLENFDMHPYIHKDCKSQVAMYNLTSVICHHGTVGGGHYTCFARNFCNNRWYEFNDHHVNEVSADTVANCQAYVLFYQKHNPQMELLRFEANELSAAYPVSQSDIRFYISREWLARFNTFSEPGAISNWSMLCPHGGVLHTKINMIQQLAVPISQNLWEFLYSKFGGGPAINMLFECEVCKRAAEALAQRQHYEHSVFQRYNGLDGELDSAGAIYAISMSWLRKWQQFAKGITHKEPGPINNANIVAGGNKDAAVKHSPMRSVRLGSDYVQISAPLWRFLHDIYGGGPEVLLRPSLTEEIVIIDEDELIDDDDGDDDDMMHGNVSDTESNMGYNNYHHEVAAAASQRNYPAENLIINEQHEEDEEEESEEENDDGGNYNPKDTEIHSPVPPHNGVKETSNVQDEDALNHNNHSNNKKSQYTAGATIYKSKKYTLRNDKYQNQQQQRHRKSSTSTAGHSNPDDATNDSRQAIKKGKTKHAVVLKNFQTLENDTAANNDSNETDV
ncbi:ubiquitin carboxyl-terminal hydrolase 33 [Musca vetustissima]|uniref:ubiquitin carboxyl-terminal hydrolase 33 n=1 Tax=Musca vetustissima TaxID=27455 RepID=UPI002AB6398E|nr:ubiquitin carboxyl-terminal hydrolase 33 [Musca vetustissima]